MVRVVGDYRLDVPAVVVLCVGDKMWIERGGMAQSPHGDFWSDRVDRRRRISDYPDLRFITTGRVHFFG
jgi:hypothetical protein